MRNTTVGLLLSGIGLVIAMSAWGSYAYGRRQWDNYDRMVDELLGREPTYNATPFVIAAIVGGVLFMAGVVFLANGNRRSD